MRKKMETRGLGLRGFGGVLEGVGACRFGNKDFRV